MLNGGTIEGKVLKAEIETRMSRTANTIQQSLGSTGQCNYTREEN